MFDNSDYSDALAFKDTMSVANTLFTVTVGKTMQDRGSESSKP